MTLFTNRYGQFTCNKGFDNGITVSTPVYITVPTEIGKGLLNSFRQKKLDELKHLGWEDIRAVTGSSVTVTDNSKPPMTPIEAELGMTEETLRSLLLGREGIPEKILFKVQDLIGQVVVDKSMVLETVGEWIDAISNQKTDETKTRKKTATRTKRTADS